MPTCAFSLVLWYMSQCCYRYAVSHVVVHTTLCVCILCVCVPTLTTLLPPSCQTEFHRLSLGFKCDMFTLEKRLRLEERSRDLAEDNVRREVSSCQGLLQVSGARERGVEKEERERKREQGKRPNDLLQVRGD